MSMYDVVINRIVGEIKDSKHTVVLTGAGMSTESGLRDFRGTNGMWNDKEIMNIACRRGMREDPASFTEFYRWRIKEVFDHEPNDGHLILSRMMDDGFVSSIITQNVDGYHRAVAHLGSKIIELHGNINWIDCSKCEHTEPSTRFMSDTSCPKCGAMMRPSIVMFGESLDSLAVNNAFDQCESADLLIVIGSSLNVSPANRLPTVTRGYGGKVVLINRDPISIKADLSIIGYDAGTILNDLYKNL